MTQDIIKTNATLKMIEGALRRATLNYIPEREIANIQALCNILDDITRENDKAIKMIYDAEEIDWIARLMRNEGSGFEAQLGEALSIADSKNAKRILQAFPEIYQKYSEQIDDDTGDSSGFGLHTDTTLGENPDMLRQD